MRHLADPSRDLVAALRRGEPGAFDTAYDHYKGRLFRFLVGLAGRRDDAEDLLQETFLRLARHAPRLRDDTDLAAWLFSVARNAFRSYRRWALLDLSRLVTLAADTAAASIAPTPEEHTQRFDDLRRVELAIRRLPLPLREALLLVAIEGMEQDRAADVAGIRPPAFRQRLARARAELARTLARTERRSHRDEEEEPHVGTT
jgi:RNA polymerase sigma-70 factor (ECF subfamily)